MKLFDAEKNGNVIRDSWDSLSKKPFGKYAFSKMIGAMVPYSGSIGAHVEELRGGYAKITLTDRRAVRNHLRSVHAIALANLAELTGNLAVMYSLPDDGRFIVAGMSLDYLKKARGTLVCESRPPFPIFSGVPEKKELDVLVEIRDQAGDVCTRVILKTLVGPKKS